MRQTTALPFYIPRNSILHQLHIVAKLLLVIFYAIVVFSSTSPWALLCLTILFAGMMILTGLPLRDPIIVGALVLILLGVGVTSTGQTIGGRLLLAAAKIVCLTMLVGLFSMTTKISAVIQFLRPSNSIASTLEPLAYMINTTLAVFPSIQYDLQRALDAETIRRGRRVRIYSVGSWATILTVVLVRALNRAERFTDTVLDRGYVPSRGLQYIGSHSFRWQDGLWALICIVPGLIIWIAVS